MERQGKRATPWCVLVIASTVMIFTMVNMSSVERFRPPDIFNASICLNRSGFNRSSQEREPSDWKKDESLHLGRIIQENFKALQNPANCSNVKKLVCTFESICGTGFGCQLHHVSSCLLMAYATNRTLVFSPNNWIYNIKLESIFLPITSNCTASVRQEKTRLKVGDPDWKEQQEVHMRHIGQIKETAKLFLLDLPARVNNSLHTFHGKPKVWWIGQSIHYAMRGQPQFNELIEHTMSAINFSHPVVGVHIRRTDKIIREAKAYQMTQYMYHVTQWFDNYEKGKPGVVRKVFIATDEPQLLVSLRNSYPGYVFLSDSSRAKSAAVSNRRSEQSIKGIALDIILLSHTDFLVCTFSSNVGRAAFALMQTHNGDASQAAVSLDNGFYYTGLAKI